MNFIYVIHMLYCNHLITHSSSNRSDRNNNGNNDNKRGRVRSARPLLIVFVATVVSVATAVCDQVVTAQHVDDIDEVHQLDPVHQVDHKDECSKIISLQKGHHKLDQPGFKKKPFPTFLEKSRGHFEGSDFKPFVILGRVPVDFKVVFGRTFFFRHLEMVQNCRKWIWVLPNADY